MSLFDNTIYIDEKEPFKNDKLDRSSEAVNLTNMFEIVENQMVMTIDSEWGTGKTTFIKMWNQQLRNEKYKTVYFNAWENDFIDEPFIAFINEIKNMINDESATKNLVEKGKELGKLILKESPKAGLKLLKDKTGLDLNEWMSEDTIKSIISEKFEEYEKAKNSIANFKVELSRVAEKQFNETSKPMVIFIDELDRCRPDFAIQLLERIKHIFNVKNIIFILGIDKKALSNSIKVIYGNDTKIEGYLTRFIDIEYNLKSPEKGVYLEYLLKKYNLQEIYRNRLRLEDGFSIEREYLYFKELIISLFDGFDLSLRETEKIFIELYMIIKQNSNRYICPYALVFLLIVKKVNINLYIKIKDCNISYKQLEKELSSHSKLINWFDDYGSHGPTVKGVLLWLINDENEVQAIKDCMVKFNDSSTIEKNLLDDIISVYNGIMQNKVYFCARKENIRRGLFRNTELYDNFSIVSR